MNMKYFVKNNKDSGDYVNLQLLPPDKQKEVKEDVTKRYASTIAQQLSRQQEGQKVNTGIATFDKQESSHK